jgi:hypothetical protein
MEPTTARALHNVLEPYHALVYFAPESRSAYQEIGLKGYWMGYFASRSAAFGPASAELVIASFYNFAPKMVRRAIPDAWSFSTPERVLETRYQVADLTTRRLLGSFDAALLEVAADLAERAARAASPEGRALFAAHAALPWPSEPHLRLWHAATLLREHRGDGHVAILLAEEIGGLEAHLFAVASGAIDRATQQPFRGWTDEEWGCAHERLRARGLLDADAEFTREGRALKQRIEDRTDLFASQPYEAIGEDGSARLLEAMRALIGAGDAVPYPNAMGLTRN